MIYVGTIFLLYPICFSLKVLPISDFATENVNWRYSGCQTGVFCQKSSLFLSNLRTASFTCFELKYPFLTQKTDFNDAVSERIQSPCLISTKSNKTPKFPKKCCFHLTGSVRNRVGGTFEGQPRQSRPLTPPYVPFGIRRFSNLCTNKSAPPFLSVARKGMLGTPGVLSGSTLSFPGQLTCVIFCILHILCLSPQERTVTVRSFPLLRYYDLC